MRMVLKQSVNFISRTFYMKVFPTQPHLYFKLNRTKCVTMRGRSRTDPWVWNQTGLHSDFQNSQRHMMERPCLYQKNFVSSLLCSLKYKINVTEVTSWPSTEEPILFLVICGVGAGDWTQAGPLSLSSTLCPVVLFLQRFHDFETLQCSQK